MKEHRKIHNLINKAINIVFWLCMTVTLWFVLQVFIFASFKIPSDSMEPGLITGDNILVWKPTIGPRIFNLFASMRNEQTEIYRIPGFKKIKRNDILVFNFPHPNSWDKIEMHILKYYIKRCVGIPGDTLSIRNGFFHVEGVQTSGYIQMGQISDTNWSQLAVSGIFRLCIVLVTGRNTIAWITLFFSLCCLYRYYFTNFAFLCGKFQSREFNYRTRKHLFKSCGIQRMAYGSLLCVQEIRC